MLPKKVHQHLEGDSCIAERLDSIIQDQFPGQIDTNFMKEHRIVGHDSKYCHVGTDSQKAISEIPVIRCQQYAAKYHELDDIS